MWIPFGLVVRISGSHPGGLGLIPGMGIFAWWKYFLKFFRMVKFLKLLYFVWKKCYTLFQIFYEGLKLLKGIVLFWSFSEALYVVICHHFILDRCVHVCTRQSMVHQDNKCCVELYRWIPGKIYLCFYHIVTMLYPNAWEDQRKPLSDN